MVQIPNAIHSIDRAVSATKLLDYITEVKQCSMGVFPVTCKGMLIDFVRP